MDRYATHACCSRRRRVCVRMRVQACLRYLHLVAVRLRVDSRHIQHGSVSARCSLPGRTSNPKVAGSSPARPIEHRGGVAPPHDCVHLNVRDVWFERGSAGSVLGPQSALSTTSFSSVPVGRQGSKAWHTRMFDLRCAYLGGRLSTDCIVVQGGMCTLCCLCAVALDRMPDPEAGRCPEGVGPVRSLRRPIEGPA